MANYKSAMKGSPKLPSATYRHRGWRGKIASAKAAATLVDDRADVDARIADLARRVAKLSADFERERLRRSPANEWAQTDVWKARSEPISDYAKAVAGFGERLGVPVASERLDEVLDMIAADSVDVFGSKEAAERFLAESPIDDGKTARIVAQDVGISRILSRIDGLRFGAFG